MLDSVIAAMQRWRPRRVHGPSTMGIPLSKVRVAPRPRGASGVEANDLGSYRWNDGDSHEWRSVKEIKKGLAQPIGSLATTTVGKETGYT
jgi:hypothetical protein